MKSDLVILILICISIVFVTLNSVTNDTKIYEYDGYLLKNDEPSGQITGSVIADLVSDFSVEDYETANGMKLTLGRVDNYDDEEKNVIPADMFLSKIP